MAATSTIIVLRRLLVALSLVSAFLTYAGPAYAGPLCSDLSSSLSINFNENDDGSVGDAGDAVDISGDDNVCRDFILGQNNAAYYLFDVGDFQHLLRITVDEVVESFGLAFTLIYHPEGTNFGIDGYSCLPYAQSGPTGTPCVEYRSLNEITGEDYSGNVTWLISWTPAIGTEAGGEIVHAPGVTNDFAILSENKFFNAFLGPNDFDCDLPYNTPCSIIEVGFAKIGDPVRSATSDNFSGAAVIESNVPEPGTLALLGLGLSGFVLNRRRNRQG
jgi:hypothetical protein